MATNPAAAPAIIVVRKKKGHGGHHGGAWKVAYADFVTAMMALFIVLWLLNTSDEVKKAVGGYFQDPSGKGKQIGSGLAGVGESLSVSKASMAQIKDVLQLALKQGVKLQKSKDHIEMAVTGEGLRIEMLETKAGLFFESGSSAPSEMGRELLATLATELGRLPNRILIEGHTDAQPFSGKPNYTNWELSADRANAARRFMEENGLRADQVQQVRGFADQDLRNPKAPEDASNRRISIIVKYNQTPEPVTETASGKPGEKGAKSESAKPAAGKPGL